jgi:hypothetical protein
MLCPICSGCQEDRVPEYSMECPCGNIGAPEYWKKFTRWRDAGLRVGFWTDGKFHRAERSGAWKKDYYQNCPWCYRRHAVLEDPVDRTQPVRKYLNCSIEVKESEWEERTLCHTPTCMGDYRTMKQWMALDRAKEEHRLEAMKRRTEKLKGRPDPRWTCGNCGTMMRESSWTKDREKSEWRTCPQWGRVRMKRRVRAKRKKT